MTKLDGNAPADSTYVADQYKDASKLDARLRLYKLYEEPGRPSFFRWVFDAIEFPRAAKVLEVGAGVGSFWFENAERIPADADIVVSDNSPPMLETARAKLDDPRMRFERVDVQQIGYPEASFDVVIANHMLYHAPDRPGALRELARVLRPGGRLYATTNCWTHLIELRALIEQFAPGAHVLPARYLADAFDAETGARELQQIFRSVRIRNRRSKLEVTDASHLLDYVRSTLSNPAGFREPDMQRHLEWLIELQGDFYLSLAAALFIAVR